MIVWLASYPRSGNTFLRTLIHSCLGLETYSIHNDVLDIEKNSSLKEITGHTLLDPKNIEAYRSDKEIYIIKTHYLPSKAMSNDRIVYLVRDGRAATSSFSKYLRNYYPDAYLPFLDLVYGMHGLGSWHEHVKGWEVYDNQHRITIKFEDMIKDPIEYVRNLSEFLDVEIQNTEIYNFSKLQQIDSKFFRKGKADSWKEELSNEDLQYFWIKSYQQMTDFKYLDGMPDYLKDVELQSILHNENIITCRFTEQKLNDLYEERYRKEQLLDDLRKEIDELNVGYKDLKEDSEILRKDKEVLTSDNEILRKDKEVLIGENEILRKDKEVLSSEKEILRKDKEVLTSDNEILRKDMEVLTSEKEILRKDKEVLIGENEILRKDKEVLSSEKEILRSVKEVLTRDNEILRKDNEYWKLESCSLKGERGKLKREIILLKDKNTSQLKRMNRKIQILAANRTNSTL